MQSRLVALIVGLLTFSAIGFGSYLLPQLSKRITLENRVEREKNNAELFDTLDRLDEPPARKNLLTNDPAKSSVVFLNGQVVATSGPQAERRVQQWGEPLPADQPILPWTDGHFLTQKVLPAEQGNYELIVLDRSDPIQSEVARAWTVTIALTVTAMFLVAAICYPLARWIMRPVKTLKHFATQIANGEIYTRATTTSGAHDLQELTQSFNSIADQLSASIQREQLFVASASHHFGNLLTPLRIRIESMNRQDPMVQETMAELDRLEMVAERLVQLSQAEEGQRAPITLDIVPIVEQTVQSWQPVVDFSKITLEVNLPTSAFALVVPGALEEILDNLIDNAVKYGNDTPITVRVIRGLSHVRVSVADKGPGLPDNQIEKAYGRFWRGAEHQNQQGSGLGLSIVQALALRCESEFSMRNLPGGGLESSLALQRSENPD